MTHERLSDLLGYAGLALGLLALAWMLLRTLAVLL